MLTIARDGWAHVVLMAALTFTDDTALLRKYILPDLLVRPLCWALLGCMAFAGCKAVTLRWVGNRWCDFWVSETLWDRRGLPACEHHHASCTMLSWLKAGQFSLPSKLAHAAAVLPSWRVCSSCITVCAGSDAGHAMCAASRAAVIASCCSIGKGKWPST